MGGKKKTIYRALRDKLNLSRDEAVYGILGDPNQPPMHGMTPSRLERIEEGKVQSVSPDDVVAMAERYNYPELRNYYCHNACAIGKRDKLEIKNSGSLHQALVTMAVALRSVNHKKIRLMEILNDGIVSDDEVEDYEIIKNELKEMAMTIDALMMWCEKMKVNKEG